MFLCFPVFSCVASFFLCVASLFLCCQFLSGQICPVLPVYPVLPVCPVLSHVSSFDFTIFEYWQVEYQLVKFDHVNKKVYVALRAQDVLKGLEEKQQTKQIQ